MTFPSSSGGDDVKLRELESSIGSGSNNTGIACFSSVEDLLKSCATKLKTRLHTSRQRLKLAQPTFHAKLKTSRKEYDMNSSAIREKV
uniref:Uncharacterized protein n=1 Tax=Romanomermis culicivorax TaxID=13658 RepID=A0A915J943_ROMCU